MLSSQCFNPITFFTLNLLTKFTSMTKQIFFAFSALFLLLPFFGQAQRNAATQENRTSVDANNKMTNTRYVALYADNTYAVLNQSQVDALTIPRDKGTEVNVPIHIYRAAEAPAETTQPQPLRSTLVAQTNDDIQARTSGGGTTTPVEPTSIPILCKCADGRYISGQMSTENGKSNCQDLCKTSSTKAPSTQQVEQATGIRVSN